MRNAPRLHHPLLSSCLAVLLSTACGKKDATEGKPKDAAAPAAAKSGDAKAGDVKAGEAKAGDAKAGDAKAGDAEPAAVLAAEAPKGKGAADNHKPLVDALAGLEGCTLNEDASDLEGECAAFDKFAAVVDESEDKDIKAIERTLVNLLADSSDSVRWSAQSRLASTDWIEDDALVATGLVALAGEKHPEIAVNLASDISNVEDERLLGDKLRPTLLATLEGLTHREAFDNLMPNASECGANEACLAMLVSIARKNTDLSNRAYAAHELLVADVLLDDGCAVASEVAVVLAKTPAPKADAGDDFVPSEQASELIGSVRGASAESGGKTKDCAAVLPTLIDEITAMATAGTLTEDVFIAALEIDTRDDGKSYLPKLEALAKAVKDNAKLGDEIKQVASDALDGWTEG